MMSATDGTLPAAAVPSFDSSMKQLLPPPLLGSISLVLLALNTLFWAVPIYLLAIPKVLVPAPAWRTQCSRMLAALAQMWVRTNNLGIWLTQRTEWDVAGVEGLDQRQSYLVNANHQSWLDIVVLQRVLSGHAPFLRFFIKQQLIWVPLLGLAWWALDMPFMRRYSREKLARHPELKGKDLETTRRSCERFRRVPVSIMNFLEGTRFTEAKHDEQGSPYRHLLRPKAGGVAFVLGAMRGRLSEMLDVTIVYPDGAPTLWDFVCGRVARIIVRVEKVRVPDELFAGSYDEDPVFRERIQTWVSELWSAKDRAIDTLLAEAT